MNKVLFRSEDLQNFSLISVPFEPSFITFHPSDAHYAMAYDRTTESVSDCVLGAVVVFDVDL